MTEQYDSTNRGVLFKVKEKVERGPDYDGTLDVGGVPYRMAAWIRESKTGTKFMSISVTEKDAKPAAQSAAKAKINPDEDIPF